jgi:2-polyprenyl-6-methoxyphenol hydroxylase-like FAD-dependent oxidoreductase
MEKNTKILIVGAGIAGLALGIRLKQLGYEPLIIDKCRKWRMKGYSLSLWPNGLKILDSFGIGDKVRSEGRIFARTQIFDKKGNILDDVSFDDFNLKYRGPYQVYRVDLHRTLRKKAHDLEIRMNTSLLAIDEKKDGVIVTFSDKTKQKFDIVIGADGINSCLRSMVFPEVKPEYLGVNGWLFWVARRPNLPKHRVISFGEKKMLILEDHGDERHIVGNFIMTDRYQGEDVPEHRISFIKEHFSDMGGLVPDILKHLPHDNDAFFHYDHSEVNTKKWHTDRIAFLGDAVHATSPFSGMGASMALEDAFVLAEEIERHTESSEAFKTYFQRRYKHVKHVLHQGDYIELLLKIPNFLIPLRNLLLKKAFSSLYIKNMEKVLNEEF